MTDPNKPGRSKRGGPPAPDDAGKRPDAGESGADAEAAPQTLGERVAFFREQAGLSQSGLARRTGLSQSAISFIEANDRSPTAETVRVLAEALQVSVGALFGDPVERLSPKEALLFRELRGLPEDVRNEMHDYMRFLRNRRRGTEREE